VIGVSPKAAPLPLERSEELFVRWLNVTDDVCSLFGDSLGLNLGGNPPVRCALAISARQDLAEIFDLGSARRVPGTVVSRYFFASGFEDERGGEALELASSWNVALRDDALHLDE
jgi:hypothetical protein